MERWKDIAEASAAAVAAVGLLIQQARIYLIRRRATAERESNTRKDIASLASQIEAVAKTAFQIREELSYNGGMSTKDMLRATSDGLKALKNRVEEIAAISQARWQITTHGSATGIFESDKNGLMTFANPALQSIFGLPEARMIGRGWLECVGRTPEERTRVWEQWMRAVRDDIPWDARFWVVRHGHAPLEVHSTARIESRGYGESKIVCGTVSPIVDHMFPHITHSDHGALKIKDHT